MKRTKLIPLQYRKMYICAECNTDKSVKYEFEGLCYCNGCILKVVTETSDLSE